MEKKEFSLNDQLVCRRIQRDGYVCMCVNLLSLDQFFRIDRRMNTDAHGIEEHALCMKKNERVGISTESPFGFKLING